MTPSPQVDIVSNLDRSNKNYPAYEINVNRQFESVLCFASASRAAARAWPPEHGRQSM